MKSNIKVLHGSCADQTVDAVVNAANSRLWCGGGICGVIFGKAGEDELTAACRRYKTPLKDGSAVITPAFGMKNAKAIIHAVGPNFNVTPDAFNELFDAYYNSLAVLKENGYHSISFPLISSSIFGGSLADAPGESAKQCIRAYKKFTADYPDYDIDVMLCAFTASEMASADKQFGELMGNVSLSWLGQMGFIIETGKTKLCVDYYASPGELRQTPPPIPAEDLKDVDVFLGTHDHLDHIDHEAWKIWAKTNPNAKFVFPRAHLDRVIKDGVDDHNAVGLNDGESVTFGDVTIHAIAAAHEFLDRDRVTGLYPYLQYVIEADGVRIHHAGDTVRYEGMMPKLRAFGSIDAEILPINGRDAKRYRNNCIGNMTYQEAADLAGEIGPRVVIPGHWDMFADNSGDPYAFADYIEAKYEGKIKCIIPKVMDRIALQRQ